MCSSRSPVHLHGQRRRGAHPLAAAAAAAAAATTVLPLKLLLGCACLACRQSRAMAPADKVPVSVVTGFLGSGERQCAFCSRCTGCWSLPAPAAGEL